MKYARVLFVISLLFFSGCTNQKKEEKIPQKIYHEHKAEKKQTVLSEAQTNLFDKTENRIENIKIAAQSIDGKRLKPEEIFSFNETVGESSSEKGYKEAPVIVDEKKEYDYGGGVCQLSSTIYQAAKYGSFEILERHEHDKEVDYAAKGEDAAVDYGNLDFKFKNNRTEDVIICSGVYENEVIVQLIVEK